MKKLLAIALLAASMIGARADGLKPILDDWPQGTEHIWQTPNESVTAYDSVDTTNVVSTWQLFLAGATTNLIIAPYGISSTDFKKFGAGLAVGYKLSDNVVPTLRIDYYDGKLWMPSGNLQLQTRLKLGPFDLYPFVFTGVAVPINSGTSAAVVGMVGTGAALRLGNNFDLLADYEVWTTLGNQIRLGIGWKPNGW